jgi:1A family penicillin-binding protein
VARLTRFFVVVVLAGVLTAASVALVAPQVGVVLSAGESAPANLIDLDPLSQRSVVLAADGSTIAVLHREENRAEVPLSSVPQVMIDTLLAVEDSEFYEHDGVNVRATARAFLTNVESGELKQGGSTITQQLVKNTFFVDPGKAADQSLERKIEEAVLARRLEDQLSKDEILERYLNSVYFGNGAYGVQAAAEVYFGKDANEIDQADAALLTGLVQNPVSDDPLRFPDAAVERRAEVLRRIVTVGQITQREADIIAFARPLPAERQDVQLERDYFVEEVQRRLLDDERLGDTQTERYNALFRGGLTIRTTLDPHLQVLATEALTTQLPDSDGRFTGAIVSLEPSTGAVKALVGGPGFGQSTYNIATQGVGRQPGSSYKPFVLAAALEAGHSARDTINGSGPCTFDPDDHPVLGIEPWEVDNYEGSRGGTYDLYGATQRSLNCAYARLVLLIGPSRAADMASRLGITTPIEPVAALALGAEEARPIDMASAYGTFANQGIHNDPYLVEEVLDRNGDVVFRQEAEGERVISADVANTVTDVLRGVVTGGTGTRARLSRQPAAGKTGTTQNSADAWFVGYTPQLSTAVWMGSPVAQIPMRNVGGVARVTGGTFPARIWRAFMEPAMEGREVVQFPAAPRARSGEQLRLPEDERQDRERTRQRTATTTTVPAGGGGTSGGGGGGGGGGDGGDGGGGGGGTPPATTPAAEQAVETTTGAPNG